jgi:two-component sensor histidine kinase
VSLEEDESQISVTIHDDGRGLPEDFDLEESGRLGLRIVQTLVEEGLHGQFEIRNDHGVSAIVRFPKAGHAWQRVEAQ